MWSGRWASELDLVGVVESDQLRALVEGKHPGSGEGLLVGHRARTVQAFDVTFSAPKSVSLLWALGSEVTADAVAAVHREAVAEALALLESKAAVTRRQVNGVRTRVSTDGFAAAQFTHRTSRAGDPQLHTHCLIPNVVRREDGRHVAFDAALLYEWGRAAGSIYQNQLQRLLVERLGVAWGPDRHNTRELDGFTVEQLRAFSKRTVAIEAELEAQGAMYESPGLRMQADERASLATRPAKDHRLSPTLLRDRWDGEAGRMGLAVGRALDEVVTRRAGRWVPPSWEQTVAALTDAEKGLCSRGARFGESDVVEHLCALSGGRFSASDVFGMTERFLASEHVVRLLPDANGRRPAAWSTVAHRQLEDEVRSLIERVAGRPGSALGQGAVTEALAAEPELGADQVAAVRTLSAPGGALRAVLAPAGFGKTLMARTAAEAAVRDGRHVIGVATTAKAVGELAAAGVPARTIARLRLDLEREPLAPGSIVVLDEISQTATRDAATLLGAVAACPDAQLWVLGDPRQSQPVGPGGAADEIGRLVESKAIPTAELTVNRRQHEPADREALALLRAGLASDSQAVRAANGWEHARASPELTRTVMAVAIAADAVALGSDRVVALTVSHGDAEDLADRVRAHLTATGQLRGPTLTGPGWTSERTYQTGDRVLLHTRCGPPSGHLVNGSTGTVTAVDSRGLTVTVDGGRQAQLPTAFVRGCRVDGSPNLSHAWARTVDGAQGGTWAVCHLLGTPSLDAYRGYTGQSRSQQPTHTWNTTPVTDMDHGGRVVERGTPAEQVAVALARQPEPTMAVRSDPFVLDRELRVRIADHRRVLAGGPSDVSAELAQAVRALRAAHDQQRIAETLVVTASAQLQAAPWRRQLSAAGRVERKMLVDHLDRAHSAVEGAAQAVTAAAHRLAELQQRQARHNAYQHGETWRQPQIAQLTRQLAQHWVDTIDTCVRAGEPLAYGIDKLRQARATVASDLGQLEAFLPPDRSAELARAFDSRRHAVVALSAATADLHAAEQALAGARHRRWGRRHAQALVQAEHQHGDVHYRHDGARTTYTDANQLVATLRGQQDERSRAFRPVQDRYAALRETRSRLDTALDDTRPARVLALLEHPTPELLDQLGHPGPRPATQAVWCHHAYQLETRADRNERPELLGLRHQRYARQDMTPPPPNWNSTPTSSDQVTPGGPKSFVPPRSTSTSEPSSLTASNNLSAFAANDDERLPLLRLRPHQPWRRPRAGQLPRVLPRLILGVLHPEPTIGSHQAVRVERQRFRCALRRIQASPMFDARALYALRRSIGPLLYRSRRARIEESEALAVVSSRTSKACRGSSSRR